MSYSTDDEKVEAIKTWWKQNGLSILAGALLGLGGIWGWRLWLNYQDSTAMHASTVFEQLVLDAAENKTEAVTQQAATLQDDFAATPYAALGALVAAKALHEAGQHDAALTALQQAIDTAPDPAIAHVAALRLARLQLAAQQLDAAAKTLAQYDVSPAFAAEFAAVRGDLAAVRGDLDAARAAYQRAIELGSSLSSLIRLKLDNLPAAG